MDQDFRRYLDERFDGLHTRLDAITDSSRRHRTISDARTEKMKDQMGEIATRIGILEETRPTQRQLLYAGLIVISVTTTIFTIIDAMLL